MTAQHVWTTRIPIVILMIAFLAPAVSPVIHGQALTTPTPTASPTPTSTPLPTGRVLIELMRKALVARRTVRVSETSQSTWTGHSVLGWTWMDLDLQANAMREVDTTQRIRPNAPSITITVERRELVLSGGVAASRKPGGSWYCEQLRGVRVRDGLVPFQMTAADVTNLGAAKIAGVPVWHVRATNAVVSAWSTNSATVDLSIAQSGGTLRRLNLSTVTQLGGIERHYKVTEIYSRYGKVITVTMPRQCR